MLHAGFSLCYVRDIVCVMAWQKLLLNNVSAADHLMVGGSDLGCKRIAAEVSPASRPLSNENKDDSPLDIPIYIYIHMATSH